MSNAADGTRREIALVACETTGVHVSDVPISIAAALVNESETGEWEVVDRWHGYQEAKVPISPDAEAIHGIRSGDLLGESFDRDRLISIVAGRVLVSWCPSFDAKMLAKVEPSLLRSEWFTFEEHYSMRSIRQEVPKGSNRAEWKIDRMLEWTSVRGGKTQKSKTWLASLLLKGRMPVHPHLEGDLPLEVVCQQAVCKVFSGALERCRIGEGFRLWTRPGMDYIAAYAHGYVNGGGLCFHISKNSAAKQLVLALERGDHVDATLAAVDGFRYHVELGKPIPMPRRPDASPR